MKLPALLGVIFLMSCAGGAVSRKTEAPARPDGKAADMSKPVQVYIRMGQSNMVGAGTIEGEKEGGLGRATAWQAIPQDSSRRSSPRQPRRSPQGPPELIRVCRGYAPISMVESDLIHRFSRPGIGA